MFYEVKAIARAKIKTDKRDSEVPAHLLRMNMIPEVYRRSTENRQAQRVLRQRAFYVSAMTALKNRVHAFLAQQREEIREVVARETNIFSEKGQKVLLGLDLAPREKKLLEALLKTYRHLETRIGESKAYVEKLYEESREAQFIRTIPGFGKYLSVLVAVEIADLTRFTDAAHLHAYAGVIPSIHSSGDRTHYGKIIKAGNRWLRWAAVGMIAIVMASLGIINTMVMSILDRYSEISIMKAVGTRDRYVRRIFLFESSAIGLLGGVFGLGLGTAVSGLINRIVNYFLARQGVPFIDYFDYPWWLFAGAVLFSVAVSLAAGIYPAMRAVRVDPVRALRHD